MDINSLKEQFYEDLAEAIKTFSRNEKNRDVYAMVLDCDSDVGGVCLRYQNRPTFESKLEEYKAYEKKYGWAVYGLRGSEYAPGEFN